MKHIELTDDEVAALIETAESCDNEAILRVFDKLDTGTRDFTPDEIVHIRTIAELLENTRKYRISKHNLIKKLTIP